MTASRRDGRPSCSARSSGEDGSASVWVLAVGALVLVVGLVGTLRGAAVLARHRAESAADLAALAAAGRIGIDDRGCAAAGLIATANGARLTACQMTLDADGRSGSVLVRVAVPMRLPIVGARSVTAGARAGRMPAT